jgi:hypothetical protein
MPLAPLSSCLFTTPPPSLVFIRPKPSPYGFYLLSRTISYLRHYLTGLWVPKKHIQRTNSSTDPAPLNLGLAACLPPFHPPIVLNRRGTSSRGSPSLQTTCFERIPLTFSESTMLLVVQRVCDRCASPLKEMAPRVILEILSARRVTPGRPRSR